MARRSRCRRRWARFRARRRGPRPRRPARSPCRRRRRRRRLARRRTRARAIRTASSRSLGHAHVDVEVGAGERIDEPGEELAGAAPTRGRVHDRGPAHGRAIVPVGGRTGRGRCSFESMPPGNLDRRPDPAPRRHRDGRQRPVGQAARPQAHRGSRRRRGGPVRHRRRRPRHRARVDDGLRVLDRELATADRRGAVPHELQREPARSGGATSSTSAASACDSSAVEVDECQAVCADRSQTPRR